MTSHAITVVAQVKTHIVVSQCFLFVFELTEPVGSFFIPRHREAHSAVAIQELK